MAAVLSVVPILLKTSFRLFPVSRRAAMMTTEIRAAINPYSIAVAPSSDIPKRRSLLRKRIVRPCPLCFPCPGSGSTVLYR